MFSGKKKGKQSRYPGMAPPIPGMYPPSGMYPPPTQGMYPPRPGENYPPTPPTYQQPVGNTTAPITGEGYYNIDARLDRLEREIIEINRRLNNVSRQVRRLENYLNIRDEN